MLKKLKKPKVSMLGKGPRMMVASGFHLLYMVPLSLTQLGSGDVLDIDDTGRCDGCGVMFNGPKL